MVDVCSGRTRGRPRDAAIDDAVQLAALDLLADGGFESLTMEAVAQRAGVAKATLYRRFANRDALLCRALARLNDDIPIPSPADHEVHVALRRALAEIRERTANGAGTRVIMRLILDGRRYPQLLDLVVQRVLIPRQQRLRTLLGQAQAEGIVPDDLDIDAAIAILIGPMVWLGMLRLGEDAIGTTSVLALQEAALGLTSAPARSRVDALAPAVGDR